MTLRILLILAALPFSHLARAAEPVQTALFTAGEGGYHTYRIPSLIVTPEGHGARLLRGPQGRPRRRRRHRPAPEAQHRRRQDVGQDAGRLGRRPTTPAATRAPSSTRRPAPIWLLLTHNLGGDTEAKIVSGKSKGSRTVWITQQHRRRRDLGEAGRDHEGREEARLDVVRDRPRRRHSTQERPAPDPVRQQVGRRQGARVARHLSATTAASRGSSAAWSARTATSARRSNWPTAR